MSELRVCVCVCMYVDSKTYAALWLIGHCFTEQPDSAVAMGCMSVPFVRSAYYEVHVLLLMLSLMMRFCRVHSRREATGKKR
jgi:hypothetical protein